MGRLRFSNHFRYLATVPLMLMSLIAHAEQPWATSVDGRLFRSGTNLPLKDANLIFVLQILNPSRNCVLYEETQVYDTNLTNGYFSLKVGSKIPDLSGKRTANDPGYSMSRIFNNTLNTFAATPGCAVGYTPGDGDARYLRVVIKPTAGALETLSPDIALTSVPSAKVAETVGGLDRSQILHVNNVGSSQLDQANLEALFNTTQLPILTALLNGTSNLYMRQGSNGTAVVPGISGNATGASAGQIWYDTASNQLKYQSNSGAQTLGVAGSGVTSVTAGTGLNVGAGPGGSITNSGTLNVNVGTSDGQIVQIQTGGKLPVLDGSNLTHLNGPSIEGNISTTGTINSGAITSTGNVSGTNLTATNSVTANDARLNALRVYKPSTSNYVEFVADAALSAPVVLTLPTALGTNGQVLQTDASGKLSWTSISNAPGGSAGGDLGGNYPNPSVNAVRGNPVAAGTLAVGDTGKVYRWSGTQFEAVNFGVDDLRTEAGLQQFATNCGADQTLTWSTITDAFACTTIGIAGTQITSGTINAARLPTIDPAKGGTGLTSLGTSNQVLGVNNAGSAMEYKSITGGAGVTITHSAGGIQVSATGSGGTVTNVTGSAPISVTNNNSTPAITISQASTTTDGYLSSTDWNTFNNKQAAGNYLTGLTGDVVATGPGSVAATIQANAITTGKINNLAVTDAKINDVAWSKVTAVPALLSAVNTGGAGNQVFGMNAAGSAGEYKSITGGSGVTITHSANGIEVSATGSGGTVTAVTAGTGLNVGAGPGGTINGSGTLNIDVGTTTGKIVQVAASNKLPVIDGSNLTNLNASNISSGTLAIAQGGTGQTTANGALNALLPSQALNSGKVLQTNGTDTSWVTPNAGTVTNVTGTAPISVTSNTTTPSITIAQANTTTSGYLSSTDWNTFNNKASTTALNSYVLKAGDTMTGALNLPSNGIAVGTNQLVVSGGNVGIGTTTPDHGLTLSSKNLAVYGNAAGNNELVHIAAGNAIGSMRNYIYMGVNDSGSAATSSSFIGAWDSRSNTDSPLVLQSSGGNVGIGTSTPTEKLEVSGKIKGTELCIGTDCRSTWPTGAGGTVTSVTSANTDISVATTTTTPVLTLNSGTGANQILKLNGSSEIPAVSGVNLTNLNASNLASGTLPTARLPAFTGDVTSSAGSNTLTLGTVPVSKGGTGVTSFGANKLVSTNGTGTALASWSCPVGQLIKFDGSGVIGCDTIAGILGYTPANGTNYVAKTGDTMSGTLNLASNGLVVGTNQLVVSGGNTGVGTASPIGALQIHQTSSGAPAIIEGTNPRLALVDTAVSPNTVSGSPAWILDSASDVFRVYRQPNVTSSGVVYLQVDNTGVTNFPGGNVGVGVSSPTERFEVAGKVKATELCIGADCRAAWPAGAGGSVTSVTSANGDITVATTTTTPVLTLNTGTGANQIVKLNASSQLPAVSGANLTNLNAGNISSGTLPVARGGTGATSFSANRLVASDGSGNLASWSCTTGQVPKFDGAGVVGCDTIANILGYTPANGTNYVAKAGDTMSGTLNLPSNGLVVGATQLVATGSRVGIGTASPSELLHVNGASTFNGAMDFRMGGVSNNAWIGASTNVWTDPHLHIGGYGASPNRKIGLWADTLFASGNVGIGNTAPVVSLDMSTRTDAIALPKGTNAQQPGSPAAGWMRYNTDKSSMEVYDGAGWKSISMSTASSPAFYVHKNGVDQAVASSTYVKLTFGTKLFDQTNAWSSDRFTPTVAGRYTFSLNVYCPNASTHCHPLIYKNGSPYAGNVGAGSGNVGNSVSAIVDMNGTTDYVEAYVYDYGTTIHGAQQWTNFSGALLAGNTTASSGSGSANTLAKWSNATTLTSSVITETSGNVGIGASAPDGKLEVRGGTSVFSSASDARSIGVRNSASDHVFYMGATAASSGNGAIRSNLVFTEAGGAERMRIEGLSGNVGIGTASPGTKLEVAGTVKATQVDSSKVAYVRALLSHCGGGCGSYHGLSTWTNTAGYNHSVYNSDTTTFTTSTNGVVTVNKAGTYKIKIYSMVIFTSGGGNQYGCPFINGSVTCPASAAEYVPHKQSPAGSWSSGVHEFVMDLAAGSVVGYGYYTGYALDYWAHDGYTGMLIHKMN